MVVREDILGGLKLAMQRGETLEQAMMSFYSAGYKKEDVEDAARAIKTEQFSAITQPNFVQQKKPTQLNLKQIVLPPAQQLKPFVKTPTTDQTNPVVQKVSAYGEQPKPQVQAQITQPALKAFQPTSIQKTPEAIQKVSAYEKPGGRKKIWIIIFSIILLALLGVLSAMFIFRPEIISFFDKL